MNNFQTQKKYICVNIRDFFQPEDTDGIRKEDLNATISSFSCPINTDVEAFLKIMLLHSRKSSSLLHI